MIDPASIPQSDVEWRHAVRIIRSVYPPIDLFEDISDPADWSFLISAEQKTNPRLMESIGNIDLVPVARRVGGPGASYVMAPFAHVSADRPSRFSNGAFGVLYAGNRFDVALLETAHHHGRFMLRTNEEAGWTSRFRQVVLDIAGRLHDLRGRDPAHTAALDPDNYGVSQLLGTALRAGGAEGLVYPSVRCEDGECAGLFYPDLAAHPVQGRHLDYHWNGNHVDLYRDAGSGQVYRII